MYFHVLSTLLNFYCPSRNSSNGNEEAENVYEADLDEADFD